MLYAINTNNDKFVAFDDAARCKAFCECADFRSIHGEVLRAMIGHDNAEMANAYPEAIFSTADDRIHGNVFFYLDYNN